MLRHRRSGSMYREIVGEALHLAWQEHHLWPLALCAGMLQSASLYDVVLTTFVKITLLQKQTRWVEQRLSSLWNVMRHPNAHSLGWLCLLALSGVLVIAISSLAQGALVDAFASPLKSTRLGLLKHSLHRAYQRLPALIMLNLFNLLALGLGRGLLLAGSVWSASQSRIAALAVISIGLGIFAVLVLAVTSIHLFCLHYLMVREQPLSTALAASAALFKRAWLMTSETALVLYVVGIVLFLFVSLLSLLMSIPLAILLVLFTTIGWTLAQHTLLLASSMLFLGLGLGSMSYAILFQYAIWHKLYRRLQQHTAAAKLQRLWLQATH